VPCFRGPLSATCRPWKNAANVCSPGACQFDPEDDDDEVEEDDEEDEEDDEADGAGRGRSLSRLLPLPLSEPPQPDAKRTTAHAMNKKTRFMIP
jgi:hypothetical protein